MRGNGPYGCVNNTSWYKTPSRVHLVGYIDNCQKISAKMAVELEIDHLHIYFDLALQRDGRLELDLLAADS